MSDVTRPDWVCSLGATKKLTLCGHECPASGGVDDEQESRAEPEDEDGNGENVLGGVSFHLPLGISLP